MKVFISWSGKVSHKAACILRDWLPVVVPQVEPWVSSEDISKGARWGQKLSKELGETSYGIICTVPGNVNEPWLNFEVGALSKSVEAFHVTPFLFGITPEELSEPLQQFQATNYDKDDILKLVKSLNSVSSPSPMDVERLNSNFKNAWPGLKEQLDPLLAEASAMKQKESKGQSNREEDEFQLQPVHIDILKTIGTAREGKMSLGELAGLFNMNPNKMHYYVETLKKNRYLTARLSTDFHFSTYRLDNKGRAHLVENSLI